MKRDKAHLVAFIGIMSALIFVLFLVETTVLSPVGMTACILSLPVAISLSLFDDWRYSFIGGTILGVCSCISCLIFSAFIQYANPLISILPRFILGITAYWTGFGLSKLFGRCKNKFVNSTLPLSIAGMVGSITNTVLYLLAANLVLGATFADAVNMIVQVAVTIYFPIELVACAVLVPVYVTAIRKFLRIDKKRQVGAAGKSEESVHDNLS